MNKLLLFFCTFIALLLGCNLDKSQEMHSSSSRYIIFPPSDLYDLIVNEKILIGEVGYRKVIDFTIKYTGLYSMGIIFDRFPLKYQKSQHNQLLLRLKLDFFDEDSLIFSKETGDSILDFASKQGNGLWLAKFNTANTIPINKTIRCKLEVLSSDQSFTEQYGDSIFFIKKASEK